MFIFKISQYILVGSPFLSPPSKFFSLSCTRPHISCFQNRCFSRFQDVPSFFLWHFPFPWKGTAESHKVCGKVFEVENFKAHIGWWLEGLSLYPGIKLSFLPPSSSKLSQTAMLKWYRDHQLVMPILWCRKEKEKEWVFLFPSSFFLLLLLPPLPFFRGIFEALTLAWERILRASFTLCPFAVVHLKSRNIEPAFCSLYNGT